MAETIERKPFKSIHIDTEKGIYLLNGEEVPMVSRIDLEFNNGKWSLLITRDELYVQKVGELSGEIHRSIKGNFLF